MRSTPFLLDGRLYHIRYDLNAAWDMECLIQPGGFQSVLKRPLTFELISDLLWFGLKWGNPDLTATDVRKMLRRAIERNFSIWHRIVNWVCKKDDMPILKGILDLCKNELFVSGWLVSPAEQMDMDLSPPGEKEPASIVKLIKDLEQHAYTCEYSGDPWKLTPAEIFDYVKSYMARAEAERKWANFNAALICSVVFNSQRKSEHDPITTWEDFAPQTRTAKTAQTPDEQMQILKQIVIMAGGRLE